MPAALASGYHGPAELTFARAFTTWHVDPWTLAAVLLLGGAYLAGARAVRRRGGTWPASRAVLFCGLGLGFAVVATMSSVGVYEPVLFYMRSVQTIVLLLVVPLFIALGRPLSLIVATVPRLGPWLESAIASRVAKLLTFPLITTFVLVVMPFVVYFTPWYAAGFRSVLVAQVTHLALILPGFVFFWTLLRVDPVPKAYPYVVALWITAAEVIGDAVLGLAVIADTNLIAGPYYHALARPWGPSLATTQVLGGGVLWIVGDIVGLPFLAAQLIQMIREDEADAKVIDAELDAADAVEEVVHAGSADMGARPAEAAQSSAQRPWWESDSRFADRFRALDDAE
ncbi:MAG TPA: cytochrome c oxidase assembly protein [Streptosporangiaceae bacterium]|nr:cytochrome c oxidase assembly protein [Streptosporangiaceae bacterium]